MPKRGTFNIGLVVVVVVALCSSSGLGYSGSPCSDLDGDGVTDCDGDCDDTNPGCRYDCSDADADGFCVPQDCDDTLAHPADSDWDGVPDACDNCPFVFNPDQEDRDDFEPSPFSMNPAPSVDVADFDGDGDLDLLSIQSLALGWYPNLDGNGTFGASIAVATTTQGIRWVRTGDIDGDGTTDAVWTTNASPAGYNIYWRANAGGTFTGPVTLIGTDDDEIHKLIVMDVDIDGDMDILYTSRAGPDRRMGYWINLDGVGQTWTLATLTLEDDTGEDLAVADIDGDGSLDIITAGIGVSVAYDTTGSGVFGAPVPVTTTLATGLAVTDLDRDGDNDIVTIESMFVDPNQETHLYWYPNVDGLGTFGSRLLITFLAVNYNAQPHYLLPADMDGDGDNDVLSVSGDIRYVGQIAWHENIDSATSWSLVPVSEARAWDMVVADIDDDGDPDVVAGHVTDGPAAWYRNGDESGDACDNCPAALNVDQADADDDDFGDVCDNCSDAANPNQTDADLDGSGDDCDNCVAVANPTQSDTDLDAVGDACDCDIANPYCATDCTDLDTDGFCVTSDCNDADSNCGSDCSDADTDGFCPPLDCNEVLTHLSDLDGDGLPDPCDNCPGVANRSQTDQDADFSGDACDCAPADANDSTPRDVAGLAFSKTQAGQVQLTWEATMGADSYSLTRGDSTDLAAGKYGRCWLEGVAGTSVMDAEAPAPGETWVYLVAAVNTLCGDGTIGYSAGGIERTNGSPQSCP